LSDEFCPEVEGFGDRCERTIAGLDSEPPWGFEWWLSVVMDDVTRERCDEERRECQPGG
jgi:hypothetical protein